MTGGRTAAILIFAPICYLIFPKKNGISWKKCPLTRKSTMWTLTQEKLRKVLFPVGSMEKQDVRKLAEKLNLPTALKKDSQGLCFIGRIDMQEFLKHFIPEKKGAVLDTKGNIIGEHNGAFYYTYGQRHGFSVAANTPLQEPLYVVGKSIEANTVTVGPRKEEKKHGVSYVVLSDTSWISGENPEEGMYDVQFRYQQKPVRGALHFENGQAIIAFKEVQTGVSEGQSLVLYEGDMCLGGGIIEATY